MAALERLGYAVIFRGEGWMECLMSGGAERWLGHGPDASSALAHAVGQAFPSEGARKLLSAAADAPGDAAPAAGSAGEAAVAKAAPARKGSKRAAAAEAKAPAPTPAPPAGAEPTPARAENPAATGAAGSPPASPPVRRGPAPAGSTSEPPPAPSSEPSFQVAPAPAQTLATDETPDEVPESTQRTVVRRRVIKAAPAPGVGATAGEDIAPAAPASKWIAEPAPPPAPVSPAVLEARAAQRDRVELAEAVEQVAEIEVEVEANRAELGLCTPQHQRLVLLAWMARARELQDRCPDRRIFDRVAVFAQTINTFCKEWWPGNVPALVRDARPADALRTLGATAYVPTRWSEVASLVEEAVAGLEASWPAARLDGYGWADAAARDPGPADPDDVLRRVVTELERFGPLGHGRLPTGLPDAGEFQSWARRLRWIRDVTTDSTGWAAAMGRLRHWASRERRYAAAARELEPSFTPRAWIDLLQTEERARVLAEQKRAEERVQRERQAEFAALALEVPPVGAPEAEVVAWLVRALPYTDQHQGDVARAIQPHAALVETLTDLPGADRRIRRRLEKLRKDLRDGVPTAPAGSTVSAAPAPMVEAGDDEEDEGRVTPVPTTAVERGVVERTRGRRAAFVTNRTDEQLKDELMARFEFSTLDWYEADPRRLDALCVSVSAARYDLVIAATGFIRHATESKVLAACKRVGIPYVRANRGRPAACLRALARDLGQSASVRVA